MQERKTVRRIAVVAAVLALGLGLAGCSNLKNPFSSSQVTLTAQLSGANEVPPNARTGSGSAEVSFNRDTRELRYSVRYSGLSGPATGAHIHGPAPVTANAPVVVLFDTLGSPINGTSRLSPAQAADLLAGRYYVNVHTAAHPAGEIRGQLMVR